MDYRVAAAQLRAVTNEALAMAAALKQLSEELPNYDSAAMRSARSILARIEAVA